MAKPKKLKSGSWNIRAYSHKDEDGKPVYVSFTHQDKNECRWMYEQWFKERDRRPKNALQMTVRDAVDKYISSSENILSPTTIPGYESTSKYGFDDLMKMPLKKLTTDIIQNEINKEAKRKCLNKNCVISPKTVKNEWSIIRSALKQQGYVFHVRLPKYQPQVSLLPEPDVVLAAFYGSDVELPCALAMLMSLRLSEIRGLTTEAIHGDMMLINQTKVNVKGKDVVKPIAKTSKSHRVLKINPYVMDLINQTEAMREYKKTGKHGFLIGMPDSTIRHTVTKVMWKHGLELSLHDLRHEYASVNLIKLGIDVRTVQGNGGWSSPITMQNTYNNGFNKEKEEAFEKNRTFYEGLISKNVKHKYEMPS